MYKQENLRYGETHDLSMYVSTQELKVEFALTFNRRREIRVLQKKKGSLFYQSNFCSQQTLQLTYNNLPVVPGHIGHRHCAKGIYKEICEFNVLIYFGAQSVYNARPRAMDMSGKRIHHASLSLGEGKGLYIGDHLRKALSWY